MFTLFGVAHLLIIAAIPTVAALLTWWSRGHSVRGRILRFTFAGLIIINELLWYSYNIRRGHFNFPHVLPLHLCDLTVWLTAASLLTRGTFIRELAYFWGLSGASIAILTPDIASPFPSYQTIQFFAAHGLVVVAILVQTWRREWRFSFAGARRAFVVLNVTAGLIGVFNLLFETNYMYLCRKPSGLSILDYFGPWPFYLLASELLGAGLFLLLSLPFRRVTESHVG